MAQYLLSIMQTFQMVSCDERGQNLAEFSMVTVCVAIVLLAGLGALDSDGMTTIAYKLRYLLVSAVR